MRHRPCTARRCEQEPAPQVLAVGGDNFQGTGQPVVIEQPGRHSQQLRHCRRGRPGGDVVKRGGTAQTVGDERGHHLAVGEQRPPAHRRDLVDQADKAEAAQVVGDEQERAPARRVPAGGGSRRAKAPAKRSSCPDAFSSSRRPRVATTRWRTLPASRCPSTSWTYWCTWSPRRTLFTLGYMLAQRYHQPTLNYKSVPCTCWHNANRQEARNDDTKLNPCTHNRQAQQGPYRVTVRNTGLAREKLVPSRPRLSKSCHEARTGGSHGSEAGEAARLLPVRR